MIINGIKQSLDLHKDSLPPSHYISDLIKYCEKLCNLDLSLSSIILYGSLVKGTFDPIYSDIDLIIVFNDLPKTYSERLKYRRKHMVKVPPGIQATWFTKEDMIANLEARTGYVLDAIYEGWVLYDQDKITSNLRNQLFNLIKDEKLLRENNHWTWPVIDVGEVIYF